MIERCAAGNRTAQIVYLRIERPLSSALWRWAPFHKSTRRRLCSAMDVAQPCNPASTLQPARSYRDRGCNGIGSGSSLYPSSICTIPKPAEGATPAHTGAQNWIVLPPFSLEICSLLHDVFCRETLPLCFASRLNKAGGRKSAEQANSEPVSVDGRMPVIAAIKGRRQFPVGPHLDRYSTIQRVADVIWVILWETQARLRLANL